MKRSIIAIGIASIVLASGCGSKKQSGDADADDAVDVAAETDGAADPAADPEPDGTVDVVEEAEPDATPDAEEDAAADAGEDAEEDPGEDPATDEGSDPGSDAGADAGSDGGGDVVSEPSGCVTLDPYAYGMCDMVLGVGWDGSACVWISGCSCVPDCAHFFTDMTSCAAACP